MGYRLTLEQRSFILSGFYGGWSLNRLAYEFRRNFHIPISSSSPSKSTIYRHVVDAVKMVDFAHPYILGYMKRVYGKPQFGNIWEADGTVVEGKKFWLIIVRDLKTCFPLGKAFSDKEDELVVDEALREAIKTSKFLPLIFRCDGNPAYTVAARKIFGSSVKIEVHKRIDGMGQNQSTEATFSILKNRINIMRGVHSTEASKIIIKGLIYDYTYVRPSITLNGKTPAEVAGIGLGSLDGNRWLALLKLATKYYKEEMAKKKKPKELKEVRRIALDHYLNSFSLSL